MRVTEYELNLGEHAWRVLRRDLEKLGIRIEEDPKDMNSFNIKINIHKYSPSNSKLNLKEEFDPRGGLKVDYEWTLFKNTINTEVLTGNL